MTPENIILLYYMLRQNKKQYRFVEKYHPYRDYRVELLKIIDKIQKRHMTRILEKI